ncbi:hypothetical protein ABZ651_20905, partial [Streptomyces sp. NPDC007070]
MRGRRPPFGAAAAGRLPFDGTAGRRLSFRRAAPRRFAVIENHTSPKYVDGSTYPTYSNNRNE